MRYDPSHYQAPCQGCAAKEREIVRLDRLVANLKTTIRHSETSKREAVQQELEACVKVTAKWHADRKTDDGNISLVQDVTARQIGKAIHQHPDALKVMLTEMLPNVVQDITKTVANVELGNVTVIDSGDGKAIAGTALARARMLTESLATLESVLGIDLRSLTQGIAGNLGNANSKSAPVPSVPAEPRLG